MRFIAVITALGLFASPAFAQNGQLSASRQIVETINVNDMSSVLQSAGFSTAFINEDTSGDKYIEATLEGAGVVYVVLRDCKGSGAAAPCGLVQPFAQFDASGVTLAQINQFNLGHSRLALAGLDDDGDGLIGAKIYLAEGVTPEHFFFSMALFFIDIDTLLSAITPGALANVSYESTPSLMAPRSKIDARPAGAGAWKVNPAGASAPKFATEAVRAAVSGR